MEMDTEERAVSELNEEANWFFESLKCTKQVQYLTATTTSTMLKKDELNLFLTWKRGGRAKAVKKIFHHKLPKDETTKQTVVLVVVTI